MAAITNTTLEVGALIVPVGLKKLSESSDVRLDRASAAGNKIGRKEIDVVTGEVVDSDSAQYGKFDNPKEGTGFRAISKDDLAAIEAATKIDTFNIEHFVPLSAVPFERATAAYYLVPQTGVSGKPLALLCKAMTKAKRAGVFKLCLRSRQYLAVLYAKNGALYINTLSFASDFRRASEAREVIEAADQPNPKMVEAAVALLDALSAEPEVIDSFEDDLVPLKQDLVAQALAGKKLTKKAAAKVEAATEPDALEAALTASVEQARKRKPRERVKV